jgi:hypothetical protein
VPYTSIDEDENKTVNELQDKVKDSTNGISNECDSPVDDGSNHTMCSNPHKCQCNCHKIPPGSTGYHRCNSCGSGAQQIECQYTDNIIKCPWQNMTCAICGIGIIVHSND